MLRVRQRNKPIVRCFGSFWTQKLSDDWLKVYKFLKKSKQTAGKVSRAESRDKLPAQQWTCLSVRIP